MTPDLTWEFREALQTVESLRVDINMLPDRNPRAKAMARTKLDECRMWITEASSE